MFSIALKLRNSKINGIDYKLKKLIAFKNDGVVKSGNTGLAVVSKPLRAISVWPHSRR